jgi:hypothetical protein
MWSTVVAHSRKKGIGVQGASAGEGEDEVWANWAKGEGEYYPYCLVNGADDQNVAERPTVSSC